MRFARLGPRGHECPVLVTDDAIFDLTSLTRDIDGEFLSGDGVERVAAAAAAGTLPDLPGAAGLRVGAPIARPQAVVCVGMNYAAHAAESGSAPPAQPIIFFKHPNTVVGPDDAVTIPPGSDRTDWEVELGVVIGRPTWQLASPAESLAHVAGFVIADDVSERDWQLERSGGQWSKGKSAPGFTPTGPWLVTPDEVDVAALRLRSFVNGQPREDSSTADLIFDVAHLVWDLSRYIAFEPGDLLLTGTPEGVALSGRFPYLRDGDVVELSIDGLGVQRQRFVTASAPAGD